MGGPGFALGLSQGLQSGQDRLIQMQQLKLQQDYAKSRQKQMEIENQLAEMQLQTLAAKMRFPSQLANLIGPQAAPLQGGAQGPTIEGRPSGFDPQRFASILAEAELHGIDTDKFLNFAQAADPTGQIKQFRRRMFGPQIIKKGVEEEVGILDLGGEEPQSSGQRSPTSEAAASAPLPAIPGAESADLQSQMDQLTRKFEEVSLFANVENDPARRAAFLEERQALLDQWLGLQMQMNQANIQAAPMTKPAISGMQPPTQPTVMPGTPKPTVPSPTKPKPQAEAQFQVVAGAHGKKPSVEETKVIGELGAMFPERMATLVQELGRPPTFREAAEYFTPEEFSQSFLAREERARKGQIEVAQQTGVAAQERAFQLAQQKEKIPQKPSAGERKDFADDAIALNNTKRLIDTFDPSMVGPITGRWLSAKEMWGDITGDEATFVGALARVRNSTIKAVTGSQSGVEEQERIMKELPTEKHSPEAFIARLRLTYVNLYELAVQRRQIAKETGLDLSDLAPLTPPDDIDPKIRENLRKIGGVTPVGKATERTKQGQAKQEEQDFLNLLTPEMHGRYQQLEPGDRAKFRERYLQKLEALPHGVR